MNNDQPTVQKTLARPRVRIPAFCRNNVSFWTRLTLLYRLLARAKDVSRQVESAPAIRQRERALRAFWQDGGDLGY